METSSQNIAIEPPPQTCDVASESASGSAPANGHEGEPSTGNDQVAREIDRYAHTDSGNAERLVAVHGDDFRYVHDRKEWLHWDGKRWKRDATAEIHRAAKDVIRKSYRCLSRITDDNRRKSLADWLRKSESRNAREAAVALASKERRVSALSTDLDKDPMLLNVLNGTLDLRTGKRRPHDRKDLITRMCPVVFDPSAKCERWRSFLDEVVPDRPDVVAFLQRSLGYTLTGDTEEQCFWLLIGPGKNGKSKFLDTIEFMLGDYSAATSFDTFAARKKGSTAISPRDGMASLVGARFVRASESDEGTRLSEAQIKALTGGEPIRTARMYQEDFAFKPEFKIWLSTNHEPRIRGTDDGIWRRIYRVPFDHVVPEDKRDLQLGEKLRAEASGILNWLLEGLRNYQKGGLQVPSPVTRATVVYRQNQNVVGRFLAEGTEKANDRDYVVATILYADFKTWAEDNGEDEMTQTAFGKEARKLLKHGRANGGKHVYYGIKLRGPDDLEEI